MCDPAKLKGFHRLKTETRRLLLKFGMPFMNGFAVPVSKTDEICNKLNDINFQFNQLKQDFIKGYNKAVDEWCQENPGMNELSVPEPFQRKRSRSGLALSTVCS
ncbi:DUF3150 domain-containing protein [Klebsiella pneumoniae]|uniref:DUF3150 domain-containing protein n=1 Tax=Klebsiella pneumoniae TaxID=573 RepID=UPI00294933F6|nr:DUF3150 domain-containing protein [Klebsiella pneumoniae]MDV5469039.1 DUF3150 domain-containing protein [Klebsiella pneumoniae]